MKTSLRFAASSLLGLTLTVLPLRAQIVNDGETRTLANDTNTLTGDVTVGTNGAFTLLVLADNALLTNSANGVISLNAAARSNEVHLVSPGARWLMGGTLRVGSNGAFSALVVSNGAFVRSTFGQIGTRPASGSNLVLVTGSGSTWSNVGFGSALSIGGSASGNQLIVSDGGRVINLNGSAIIGNIGSNNLARVIGSGSVWSNFASLNIGVTGLGNVNNRLLIENGGTMFNDDAFVGGGNGSSNNFAIVDGSGSIWRNRDLYVGNIEGRNGLVVSNGGTVLSRNGYLPTRSNAGMVTGTGSLWNNLNDLVVGQVGAENALMVRNGGWVANSNGYVGGFIPSDVLASNNTVVVTGAGSTWSNRADLFVGFAGRGNQLVMSNGGTVVVGGNTTLGRESSASSNSALVTDAGTAWLLSSNVYVGSNGPRTRITIANGGRVVSRSVFVGFTGLSGTNAVVVTGSGSVWSNAPGESFYLGFDGGGNQLVVSNGASMRLSYGVLGHHSHTNAGEITGPGSLLNVTLFVVGDVGDGNRLVVSNGAAVNTFVALLGQNAGSKNNEAVVTGAGSSWTSLSTLVVGFGGDGNRLVITNGAEVFGGFSGGDPEIGVIVGDQPSATNSRVVVDGGALRATNVLGTGTLDVRRGTNVFNAGVMEVDRLLVTNDLGRFEFNGGTLITRGAVISNNAVSFTVGTAGRPPAVWDMRAGPGDNFISGSLSVGESSAFNQVFLTNGAILLTESTTTIGSAPFVSTAAAGNSNSAVISGAGSRWTANGFFEVGTVGSFNRLVIANGGVVEDTSGIIGSSDVSSNNFALVTGAGSLWTNRGSLFVGGDAAGNHLVVSNGGTVATGAGKVIGLSVGGHSNSVTVTDAGSRWLGDDPLYLGWDSASSRLTIANGGQVTSSQGLFAHNGTISSNNMAWVTGIGSIWNISSSLVLGEIGAGNQLVVSNGGKVTATFVEMGQTSSSSNNRAVVTGSGSSWNISSNIIVGDFGADNQLVVSNGGALSVASCILGKFTSLNNRMVVDNGSLLVLRGGIGTLEVRRGTNVLNAGLIETDILLMTNGTLSRFEFNGGTLSVKNSDVVNGQIFRVGNGVTPATLVLASNGFHSFGPAGLSVSANGTLAGNGTISGAVAVQPGGVLSPGAPIGRLLLPSLMMASLQGTIQMELSKDGLVLTNDVIQKSGLLAYGGSLRVSHLGPTALAKGDHFRLFIASSYSGSFSSLSLPPLESGLAWNNKLLVDGSIEVAEPPSIRLDLTNGFPRISGLGETNATHGIDAATNLSPPIFWQRIGNPSADGAGQFLFTDTNAPSFPMRFYRVLFP